MDDHKKGRYSKTVKRDEMFQERSNLDSVQDERLIDFQETTIRRASIRTDEDHRFQDYDNL